MAAVEDSNYQEGRRVDGEARAGSLVYTPNVLLSRGGTCDADGYLSINET